MASSVTLAITYILSEAQLQSQITLIGNIYQKKTGRQPIYLLVRIHLITIINNLSHLFFLTNQNYEN